MLVIKIPSSQPYFFLGHTVVHEGKKFAFHLVPCGILYPNVKNILGNGTVISLEALFKEIASVEKENIDFTGRLILSNRAHIVTKMHLLADAQSESKSGGIFRLYNRQ